MVHVVRMEEIRTAYIVTVRNPGVKRPLARPGHRRDNIKMVGSMAGGYGLD